MITKLRYDDSTGVLTWKTTKAKAGWLDTTTGYWNVQVDNTTYKYHRLVWYIVTGEMPTKDLTIDHIDHNKSNNRFINLRLVPQATNCRNLSMAKNNTSGVTGVSWCKRARKWQAKIKVNYRTKFLGYFVDIEEAKIARKEAETYYGFHNNHGV